MPTFATLSRQTARALSSAGSERLPYKQRVGGSNPSAPTTQFKKVKSLHDVRAFFYSGMGDSENSECSEAEERYRAGGSSLKTMRWTPSCQRVLVMRKRPISAV